MPHPNEELVRRAYREFGVGNLAAVRSMLTEDVVWHFPGAVTGEETHGPEELLAHVVSVYLRSGGSITWEITEVAADGDDRVTVRGIMRASRDGRALEDTFTEEIRLRDGRIAEARHHPRDQAALDRFWS
ncbi:MAG: nuclear transport factor 2 family protein [Actinobacteria bacterium]|nr:nuclear transport factor 2 family protein [Actinomycetota bacterium]